MSADRHASTFHLVCQWPLASFGHGGGIWKLPGGVMFLEAKNRTTFPGNGTSVMKPVLGDVPTKLILSSD